MAGSKPGLGLQSECPQAIIRGSFLTFDLSIKIEILHALLAVSMPSILLLSICVCGKQFLSLIKVEEHIIGRASPATVMQVMQIEICDI